MTDAMIEGAIRLRKMPLGEAIIAATVLEFGHELHTRNTQDIRDTPSFMGIGRLAP